MQLQLSNFTTYIYIPEIVYDVYRGRVNEKAIRYISCFFSTEKPQKSCQNFFFK